MRKAIICLAFLIYLPLTVSAQETATVNCLGQKKVDLTTVPEGTKIVAELKCGDKVVVLERSGGWAKVRTSNGKVGNLASAFLSITATEGQVAIATSSVDGAESALPVIGVAYASCDRLPNVQLFAEKDHRSSIATIACGEKVDVLAYEGTSVRVRKDNGVQGYVTSYFLESQAEHAVFSTGKSPDKYPLTLDVVDASSQAYTRYRMPDTPATPAVTQCNGSVSSTGTANGGVINTNGNVDVTCKTTPSTPVQPGAEIKNVRVTLQATLNGVQMAIGCNAGWAASHCGELSSGSYQARWKNESHKQIRVLVLQAGKLKEITLDVH